MWPETETRKPSRERMHNLSKDTQHTCPLAPGGSLPTNLRPDPASQAKEPKAIMKIEHLNATFQPAKIGHPHGLQVTYLKDNSTRNIFVYHEDGKVGARLGASREAAGGGAGGGMSGQPAPGAADVRMGSWVWGWEWGQEPGF